MTPERQQELKQLALDTADGKVFTDRHLSKNQYDLLPNIFMPLLFLNEELKAKLEKECVLVYEYLEKAGPRSINGYPMFMSFRYLTQEELELFANYYDKAVELKKDVLKKMDEPVKKE